MNTNFMKDVLRDDEARVMPNEALKLKLMKEMDRPRFGARRLMRPMTLVGAMAMLVVVFASVQLLQPRGASSFIVQANAAYSDLQAELSQPGAVRHMVTLLNFGPGNGDSTSETWTTADGKTTLSGGLGSPNVLSIDGMLYQEPVPEMKDDAFGFIGGSGGVITSNPDGSWSSMAISSDSPHYSMTTSPDTASFMAWTDPDDFTVSCVVITPLTERQKAARDVVSAISEANDEISAGTAGPEALLSVLDASQAVEDRGIQPDVIVGDVHVYRITYEAVGGSVVGEGVDSQKGYQEFGFSPETYLLRLQRSGSIDASGKETEDFTMRVMVDEVLTADDVAPDLFSADRLGYVAVPPPAEVDSVSSWPSYEYKNGCYKAEKDAPVWLDAEATAAAQARIAAGGDTVPSLGGGGF